MEAGASQHSRPVTPCTSLLTRNHRSQRHVFWKSLVAIGLFVALSMLASSQRFSATFLEQIKYFYIPDSTLKHNYRIDAAVKHAVLSEALEPLESFQMRTFSGPRLYQLQDNQTTAPPGEIRSCAISSLVLQAKLVLNGWSTCGYMLLEGPNLGLNTSMGDISQAVISAPPNQTLCTPAMMGTDECGTQFVRTLLRNDPASLRTCISHVRGISQTCNAYSKCGPRIHTVDSNTVDASPPGVCNTPDVGYFKEPEVLRMCGVCDMFKNLCPQGQDTAAKDHFARELIAAGDGHAAFGSLAADLQSVRRKA